MTEHDLYAALVDLQLAFDDAALALVLDRRLEQLLDALEVGRWN